MLLPTSVDCISGQYVMDASRKAVDALNATEIMIDYESTLKNKSIEFYVKSQTYALVLEWQNWIFNRKRGLKMIRNCLGSPSSKSKSWNSFCEENQRTLQSGSISVFLKENDLLDYHRNFFQKVNHLNLNYISHQRPEKIHMPKLSSKLKRKFFVMLILKLDKPFLWKIINENFLLPVFNVKSNATPPLILTDTFTSKTSWSKKLLTDYETDGPSCSENICFFSTYWKL